MAVENHFMATGVIEPAFLTDHQYVTLEDRIKQLEQGEAKLLNWKEVKMKLKEKYPEFDCSETLRDWMK